MTLLFQEDDCAPDAMDSFEKKFKAEVGIDFQYWKNTSDISSKGTFFIVEDDVYLLQIESGNPYWKLYKK